MAPTKSQKRVDSGDWDAITAEVNDFGGALLPRLPTTSEAETIRAHYPDDRLFRATIDMGRYRFGEGQYRYFRQPYPEPIQPLKEALYPRLLPIARDWWTKLGRESPWPDDLDDWLDVCHASGQSKSTAILLKYGAGDWNALHRDLYGDLVFPLQVVINLIEPGVEHTGGEFLRPFGHGFVFTTHERPVRSVRRAPHPRAGFPRRSVITLSTSVPVSPSGPSACRSTASTRTRSHSDSLISNELTTSSALGNSW
jgi:uncharacterized protein